MHALGATKACIYSHPSYLYKNKCTNLPRKYTSVLYCNAQYYETYYIHALKRYRYNL